MKPRAAIIVVAIGAALGFVFASVSTHDFVQHLDRQVHSIHCSFVPGLGVKDASGTSGCQTTMMSPYSSVMRGTLWGGIPVSLPAMSVFAFLFAFAVELVMSGRQYTRKALGFLVLSTALPVLTSAVMGYISFATLGTACKLCIGIYFGSGLTFLGAAAAWFKASPIGKIEFDDDAADEPTADAAPTDEPAWTAPVAEPEVDPLPERRSTDDEIARMFGRRAASHVSGSYLAGAFAVGVLFVTVPVGAYVAAAPSHAAYVAECGLLDRPKDTYGVMVPLGAQDNPVPAIEVLDPLCPACRAFETRLQGSGVSASISRKAILFPLDNSCNWMIEQSIHPGACTISEAMLCAGDQAEEVLDWAFANQQRILEGSSKDPRAARRMVKEKFPKLTGCVGSATVRAKLNKSLRWAVKNRLQVLTPQLYVAGVRLCDEDLDLGLEFAMGTLVSRYKSGTLPKIEYKPDPPKVTETIKDDDAQDAAEAKDSVVDETSEVAAGAKDAASAAKIDAEDPSAAEGEVDAVPVDVPAPEPIDAGGTP